MRRALVSEPLLAQVLEQAHERGLSVHVRTDLFGESTFQIAGSPDRFNDIESLTAALEVRDVQ